MYEVKPQRFCWPQGGPRGSSESGKGILSESFQEHQLILLRDAFVPPPHVRESNGAPLSRKRTSFSTQNVRTLLIRLQFNCVCQSSAITRVSERKNSGFQFPHLDHKNDMSNTRNKHEPWYGILKSNDNIHSSCICRHRSSASDVLVHVHRNGRGEDLGDSKPPASPTCDYVFAANSLNC